METIMLVDSDVKNNITRKFFFLDVRPTGIEMLVLVLVHEKENLMQEFWIWHPHNQVPSSLFELDAMHAKGDIEYKNLLDIVHVDQNVRKNCYNSTITPEDYREFQEKWNLAEKIIRYKDVAPYLVSRKYLVCAPVLQLKDTLTELVNHFGYR